MKLTGKRKLLIATTAAAFGLACALAWTSTSTATPSNDMVPEGIATPHDAMVTLAVRGMT